MDQSIYKSTNQSINPSINQSINQTIDQIISQSTDRSINQSVSFRIYNRKQTNKTAIEMNLKYTHVSPLFLIRGTVCP